MKITNDANTTIIGSNTTVVIPNNDGISVYVVVTCNSGRSYKIDKDCYIALKELFEEEIGKVEHNKPIIEG